MIYTAILILYLSSIYFLYILVFYKLVFPIRQRCIVVMLNNNETRWWWGFVTHQLEINLFLWIPYKIKNINFLDINSFTTTSFEPFKSNLSKKLSFRDCNYSIFNEENKERLYLFCEKSLNFRPNNILLFNFSFLEYIFPNFTFKFKGFKFNKENLFRNLSHIISDTDDWLHNRKNIIMKFWLKIWLFIFMIPFYPHYIIFKSVIGKKTKNLIILNENFQDKPKWNYIWVEENNLIWRKWNRYLSNYTEYNLYVEEMDEVHIYWKWMIKIFKTLLSDVSFPIAWDYKASIKWVFSENFTFKNEYNLIQIKNWQSLFYEIPFTFKLPKSWEINIVAWPWTLSNNIVINFQTKIFYLLPTTNLNKKIDHLNKQNLELKNNFNLKYWVIYDKSPLKFQSRKIVRDWTIYISFNKELVNLSEKNFTILYKWKEIWIVWIEQKWENKTDIYIHYPSFLIEKYDFTTEKDLASLTYKKLEDKTWTVHFTKPREIKLVW